MTPKSFDINELLSKKKRKENNEKKNQETWINKLIREVLKISISHSISRWTSRKLFPSTSLRDLRFLARFAPQSSSSLSSGYHPMLGMHKLGITSAERPSWTEWGSHWYSIIIDRYSRRFSKSEGVTKIGNPFAVLIRKISPQNQLIHGTEFTSSTGLKEEDQVSELCGGLWLDSWVEGTAVIRFFNQ